MKACPVLFFKLNNIQAPGSPDRGRISVFRHYGTSIWREWQKILRELCFGKGRGIIFGIGVKTFCSLRYFDKNTVNLQIIPPAGMLY